MDRSGRRASPWRPDATSTVDVDDMDVGKSTVEISRQFGIGGVRTLGTSDRRGGRGR